MPSLWPSLLLALPTALVVGQHHCDNIRADKQSFDLKPLGGPKTVHHMIWREPSIHNWTYTLDICAPLKDDFDLPKPDRCRSGTYVCGKNWVYNPAEKKETIDQVISIAGQFQTTDGRGLEPKYTRLKGSASNAEKGLEGVRVELNGGRYPFHGDPAVRQKAVIEFLCDPDVTGLDGFDEEGKMLLHSRTEDDDDNDDDEKPPNMPDLDKGKTLKFVSYDEEGSDKVGVLRLEWKTKYACENAVGDGDSKKPTDSSKGWGFFTWFLIILFLLAASYIIFGSWLNYQRYGARGWDLLPHGDTIRDIPYIVKDWSQSAMDKFSGGPQGRGGYSAV